MTTLAAPSLTGAEWAAMIADPLRDHGYQLTGLGPSVADYLARRAVAGLADRTLDQYERDPRDLEHAIATRWQRPNRSDTLPMVLPSPPRPLAGRAPRPAGECSRHREERQL